jgi:hypothetical protein
MGFSSFKSNGSNALLLFSTDPSIIYPANVNFGVFNPSKFGITGESTNSLKYTVHTFTDTTSDTYRIKYNCSKATTISIFAVGGGGSGGFDNAGGGGAGGVVLARVLIPVGRDVITIQVWAGQIQTRSSNVGNGRTTYVSFARPKPRFEYYRGGRRERDVI